MRQQSNYLFITNLQTTRLNVSGRPCPSLCTIQAHEGDRRRLEGLHKEHPRSADGGPSHSLTSLFENVLCKEVGSCARRLGRKVDSYIIAYENTGKKLMNYRDNWTITGAAKGVLLCNGASNSQGKGARCDSSSISDSYTTSHQVINEVSSLLPRTEVIS
jgi:hypothetical protein